jgi:uncharacterized membrane protein
MTLNVIFLYISGWIGLIHTIAAVISFISGSVVLLNRKGTAFHKKVGYIYVSSMLIVNISAFFLYNLFNGFGIFHFFACLSLFAIFGGMYPVILRHRVKNWYIQHIEVMCWSIVGLYAAFAAEVSVRLLPQEYSLTVLGVSGGIITTIGAILIRRRKKSELNKTV